MKEFLRRWRDRLAAAWCAIADEPCRCDACVDARSAARAGKMATIVVPTPTGCAVALHAPYHAVYLMPPKMARCVGRGLLRAADDADVETQRETGAAARN